MIAITDAGQIVDLRENSFFAISEVADPDAVSASLGIKRVSAPGLLSDIPKLPYEQWLQTVGFHRWSYKTFKQETHISHFITKDKQFITVPFHQTVSGMTIKIDLQTPENQELLNQLTEEYGIDVGGFHGTTHNHVNMSAFQSGTDKHDEEGQQGVHFTLGNLGQKDMSIHARVSAIFNGDISLIEPGKPIPAGAKILKKMMDLSAMSILSFIEIPYIDSNFKEMPKEYIDAALKRYVTSIGFDKEIPFPEEWKSRVTEKKYTPTQNWVGQHTLAGTGGTLSPSVGTLRVSAGQPTGAAQTKGSQQFSSVPEALTGQFHTGLMNLFVIVASARIKTPKLSNFSSKELIESLSEIGVLEHNNTFLTEFHKIHAREVGPNRHATTVIRAYENDELAWNKAWKALALDDNNAGTQHSYRLAANLAKNFNPLYIELLNK